MPDIFSDITFDFDIVSEKKLTADERKNVENMEDTKLELDVSLESISNKKKNPLKRLDVLTMTNVKTSNDFINTVQDNENKKRDTELKRVKHSDNEFPYRRIEVMTDAEKQLFNFMSNYLDCKDRIHIFPKIRLADLIEVDPTLSLDKQYFYKIASKHVDYVICKKDTFDIICAVELDDFYHDKKERKERDLFVMQALYTAGIDVVRIKVPIKTICKADLDYLDNKINTVLAPPCPYCGLKMVPKKSMHNNNKGHRFFSCPNFLVGCRYTINIDQYGEDLP